MQMRKLALSLLLLGMAGSVAHAEDLTGTLKKIKDNGVIVVGHRESSVPFSYYDNQQKVVGYSQDYSNQIVEAVKKKLNAPNLQVKMLPITSQNRIPLLQNGTYDFECGSTTNNLERQKQAAFSDTIFRGRHPLAGEKGSDIKDFKDLAGKTGGGHLRHHLRSAAEQAERQRQDEHAHHQRQRSRRFLPHSGKRPRRGLHDG